MKNNCCKCVFSCGKVVTKSDEGDSKYICTDVSHSEDKINIKSYDDNDNDDEEDRSEYQDGEEEYGVMHEEEDEKERNCLAEVGKSDFKNRKDAKDHKREIDGVDDKQKALLISQSRLLSQEDSKMLKAAPTANAVQFSKGIKRKVDVEVNYEKGIVSLKDEEKWHKKARCEKAIRLATVLVNDSNNDTLNINSLPNEVILEIFDYLKQNQLGQIARVCRKWNALTKSSILWKKVNVQIFPSHRSLTATTKCFINRLPSCLTSIRLEFMHGRYERLDFVKICMKLQEKCPHLEVLVLSRCNFSSSFSSVIELCIHFLQDLKKLVFCNSRFANCRLAGDWSGISKIEILHVFNCQSDCSLPLNKPPLSRMPYLKQLQFYCSYIKDSFFEGDISFLDQLHVLNVSYTASSITSRTLSAIKNHGLNLKELCLCSVELKDHDLNFNYSVFPQLKTICLNHCPYVSCGGVVSLIQSCQSLQNVYVNKRLAKSFSTHHFFVANRCKSEIVKATECNHYEVFDKYF